MQGKIHAFRRMLSEKKRDLVLTNHAQTRASERNIEYRLIQSDLRQGHIIQIEEQASDEVEERVFDIRLIGKDGWPMRYLIAINSLIRVITLMKVSRNKPRHLK